MTSADEYRRQISALGADRLETRASSLADAKSALTTVRSLRKQLRQMKRDINLDMKAMRAEYRQRSPEAAVGSSAAENQPGQGKHAGRLPGGERKRLAAERAQKLAPYDDVKRTVDDLLSDAAVGEIGPECPLCIDIPARDTRVLLVGR